MTKFLYFDPFNGAAGDMIVGALIDLGLPLVHLKTELKKVDIGGYELRAEDIERQGLSGVDFSVRLAERDEGGESASHSHAAHSATSGRDLVEIRDLIARSHLSEKVKDWALAIFHRLAAAEARVHGHEVEKVHFHEVGAVDAIVDIVAACVGFEYHEIVEFYTGPFVLGQGMVTFSHGTWPVPTPATLELVRDFPSRIGDIHAELTTPTGAAIITALAKPLPAVDLLFESAGLGAGDRQLEAVPNMLRLMTGNRSYKQELQEQPLAPSEAIVVLEASIDDMEGETYGHFLDLALSERALDVFYTPVQMKKNRPGHLLTLLCRPEDEFRMARLIFRETTTLGLRVHRESRWFLEREQRTIATRLGEIRIKIARLDGKIVNARPEFEDLRRAARDQGVSIKEARAMVSQAIADLTDE